jgi:hypothetical protein
VKLCRTVKADLEDIFLVGQPSPTSYTKYSRFPQRQAQKYLKKSNNVVYTSTYARHQTPYKQYNNIDKTQQAKRKTLTVCTCIEIIIFIK